MPARRILALPILAVLALLTACGGADPTPPKPSIRDDAGTPVVTAPDEVVPVFHVGANKCLNCAVNVLIRRLLEAPTLDERLAGCTACTFEGMGLDAPDLVLDAANQTVLTERGWVQEEGRYPLVRLFHGRRQGRTTVSVMRRESAEGADFTILASCILVPRDDGWDISMVTTDGPILPAAGSGPERLGDEGTCLNRVCDVAILNFLDRAVQEDTPPMAKEYFFASGGPMPPGADEPLLVGQQVLERLAALGCGEALLVDFDEFSASLVEHGGRPALFIANGSDVDTRLLLLDRGERGWRIDNPAVPSERAGGPIVPSP